MHNTALVGVPQSEPVYIRRAGWSLGLSYADTGAHCQTLPSVGTRGLRVIPLIQRGKSGVFFVFVFYPPADGEK